MLQTIKATVIAENQAIRLRARKEGVDRGGVRRVTGGEPASRSEVKDLFIAKAQFNVRQCFQGL